MIETNIRKGLAILLLFLFSILSCQNSSDWYPDGKVSVSSFSEDTDASGDKYCTVFYCIENVGQSKISQSTISFLITTDKNEYYVTKVNENSILPDGKIWDSIVVTYFDPTEISSKDNVSIKDSFFE